MSEAFQFAAMIFCLLMALYSMLRGHPVHVCIVLNFVAAVAAFIVAMPG